MNPEAQKMLELIEATKRQLVLWPSSERVEAESRWAVSGDGDEDAVLLDPRYALVLAVMEAASEALTDVQRVIVDGVRQCSGCIGRGTGTRCCACGLTIPPELWRRPGSPDEIRDDCSGCRAGRAHTHGGDQ